MKRYFYRLLLAALLFTGNNVYAQKDTIFWFAAPNVAASEGDSPIFLRFLTYDDAADITVSIPANGAFTPINLSIPANSVDSVDLSAFLADVESPAADVVADNGLKITSTELISTCYEVRTSGNKEYFSLKGGKALGDNFYTPFQKHWSVGASTPSSFSSIEIVATEDNTTVLITPRTNVPGHAQDLSFPVTLNEGQTYSVRDLDPAASTSLAGSIISANKPVAVTIYEGALSEAGCQNSIGDQITNADYAGTDFIIHKGTAATDRVYIMATQNGTSVDVINTTTTSSLISWGETMEVALSDTFNYITTNKPVYVWHVSSYGCDLSAAQVPNLFCAGTYETAFTRTSSDSLGLILYTRSGFENQFTLNGSPVLIPPGDFSDVPGTGGEFKVATIFYNTTDVPVNSYNLVANTGDIFGLGVLTGNDGSGSAYTYLSEFNSYPFVDAGADDTICANTSINLNGISGGGTVTGVWSTTGFGSFSSPNDQLINEYVASPLDSLITPINLILTSTGPCPVQKDTLVLSIDPAPIVSASADQVLCENNAVTALNGSVNGGASTGVWTTLGTGNFSPDANTLNADYVPSAADLSAGSVELVLTATNFGSCNAEDDTVQISFTPQPVVDAGGDTLYACENNPDTGLSGAVSGGTTTGKWITSGTGLFSPDNLTLNATYEPSPQDVNGGSVWLFLTSTSNGDCNPETDSLLLIFTSPPIVDAGTNSLVCQNDSVYTLSGSISGATTTGIWSGGTGTFSPNNTDLNATYTPSAAEISSGNVFLTLTSTNNNGCIAVNDVVQINYVEPPFANFNFTEECLYDENVFTDFSLPGYGNIDTWQWDFGDGATSTQQNDVHQYGSAGTYDVQLVVTSTVGCSDTVVNSVQSFDLPVADYSYTSDCPNNQIIVSFTDESVSADPLNYWFYDFGGQGSQAVENPTQLFQPNADYTITHIVGTVNGCYDTITGTLSSPPFPQAGFGYTSDNGLNIGAQFSFSSTATNADTYFWDLGNGNTSTEINPDNTYFQNGNYTVTQFVTGALGCTDSAFQVITINTVTTEIPQLIPNAISPNGDNKNDVWKLEFIQLLFPNARVEIFNEWGQRIFESDGYETPWDGTYSGELVPDGTYYYVIDLKGAGDETDIYKGTILVLKSRK